MLKVVTAVVNNPVFIEIQYNTLKKYMTCDYEFIVFNDAKAFPDLTNGGDVTIRTQIEKVCEDLNITCINIPNDNHQVNRDPCIRCADAMNFILEYQKVNPWKYLCLDSDMFLVDFFDIKDYEKYTAAMVLQNRLNNEITYCWNGLYYFDFTIINNQELMDWGCDEFGKCDVGGRMRFWLRLQDNDLPTNNQIRDYEYGEYNVLNKSSLYFIKHLCSNGWDESEYPDNLALPLLEFLKNDPRNRDGKIFCELYDKKFLHYRAGGNWNMEGMKFHHELSLNFKKFLS